MKFDFAIGNPPYQEDRPGESNTALPVYHQFLDAAINIADKVEMIHPARFLFNAGRTPKDWNEKMLSDEHYKVLEYEQDASKVFSNTDIKGGVAITYRDVSQNFGSIGAFTIYPELNTILSAVKKTSSAMLSSIAFVCNKFNIITLVEDYPQYEGHERRLSSNVLLFPCFVDKPKSNKFIAIYGVINNKRTVKYINEKYIDMSDNSLSKYKVIMPKADGNGVYGEIITNPEILNMKYGFTHTFLGLGAFNTKNEAENELKYIKTKFARSLFSIAKVTQNVNAETWRFVPIQDFTKKSDIDWTKSIKDIDRQLYKKYKLSQDEIDFIEIHVKEME